MTQTISQPIFDHVGGLKVNVSPEIPLSVQKNENVYWKLSIYRMYFRFEGHAQSTQCDCIKLLNHMTKYCKEDKSGINPIV